MTKKKNPTNRWMLFGMVLLVLIAGLTLSVVVYKALAAPPGGETGVDDTPGDDVNNTIPDPDPRTADPKDAGPWEKAYFQTYENVYVADTGAIISNHVPLPWCPNSCIGCDDDVTSEAVARLMLYAAQTGDKVTFDREVNFYHTTMKHPETGHMMWKLNPDGSSGSCGGVNSAVDAELIAITALEKAMDRWGATANDGKGHTYKATQKTLMDSMKGGVIDTKFGKTLPMCMYPQGSETRACENKVFIGYLGLDSMRTMAKHDSFWNDVYVGSKNLMMASTNNQGAYSVYYADGDRFNYEMADIHTNWVIKHLIESGDPDAYQDVKAFYEQTRDTWLANAAGGHYEICQEFSPTTGCKLSNPPLRVYGHWLESASARCAITQSDADCDFRDELIKFMKWKIDAVKGPDNLPNDDNFGNIVNLEALADARESGGVVG